MNKTILSKQEVQSAYIRAIQGIMDPEEKKFTIRVHGIYILAVLGALLIVALAFGRPGFVYIGTVILVSLMVTIFFIVFIYEPR